MQSYCTDWKIFVAYDHSPKYSFSGTWFMLSNEKKLYQYKCDRDRWHHGNLLEWRLFLIFSGKLAVVFDLFTLQDKHNIRTLSVNITFIWNRCETDGKARRRLAFSLFLKLVEINFIFVDNVCILFIYFTRKSQYLTDSNAVGTDYFSGASEFRVRVVQSLVFCVVFCRSLFVLWPLYCLSFFDLQILQTSLSWWCRNVCLIWRKTYF